MKKITIISILGLFLATIVTSSGLAQTSEEIVAKMIKAQGGKAVLEKIEDMTLTGMLEIVSIGVSGSMTMYRKEPNKARMDMELMGMVMTQAYDGENAWGVDPSTGSIQDMPEDQAKEFKRMAMGNEAILHPEKFGITFTPKGKETIEGKDYILVEQAYDDGHKETLYLDSETYLLYKTKSMSANMAGMQVDTESFVSDYKEVNGLMVWHSMRIVQEGEEAMVMTFTEVSINTGLEDSLFKKEE
ncbi:MAG: outer membrane lipoprotein-sorting protein [Candidatus Aminicenantes bacterium]|nr:MAG: outer membrane lipoprotein-sorting protein [Candidatus Aminicenantes bacterium]